MPAPGSPFAWPPEPALPTRSDRWPLAAAAVIALAFVVVGRSVDVGQYMGAAQEWTGALGFLAPAIYVVVYVAATLVGVPSMPFSLLAPVLFGVVIGIGVMGVASTISAAFGFLIARYLARDLIRARLAGTDGFARVSALVEEHDWVLIPILRTFPIAPFAVVNYGFGLTGIGFWRYLAWSALAMVPSNVVVVLGAQFFYDGTMRGTASWPLLGTTGAVVVGGIVVVAVGRRALPWLVRSSR